MKSTAFDMAMMAYRQNDMEGAFRQFLPLAETGDADAMNMAANMFERGQGTYRDPGRAVFWWKKAVELGNVDALADYGQYLVTTFFDGKEQKLGAGYLVTATERGNNRAGESLVEFALKNNDAGVKVYRTATEYCDRPLRQILICVHSMCRKRVCLNISSDSTGLETIMYIWQRYFRQ
jgi:TPR repeat protein